MTFGFPILNKKDVSHPYYAEFYQASDFPLETRDKLTLCLSLLDVGIFAGSDTTAIAMRSIVDNLLRHPEAKAKLRAELDKAVEEGQLDWPVRYAQASKLPFFTACVKEGMRLHPSVGLHLPRIVPAGGCQIAGQYFPAGSCVGVNPTVLHRNEAIFGEKPNEFRPERWLDAAKVSEMEVS